MKIKDCENQSELLFQLKKKILSVHKDPYENIYCVISGHKDFILIPPVSYHNVPRRRFPSGVFKTDPQTEKMEIQPILDGE